MGVDELGRHGTEEWIFYYRDMVYPTNNPTLLNYVLLMNLDRILHELLTINKCTSRSSN